MFGVSLGIKVGNSNISGGGFDADAQAYFSRVTTAGGTLTTTEQNAVNQLVLDMKANGTWTPMKAIYPMVGSSAAACAQNLKSSSFTGTFTSGWTFASTGATPNGSSAYMDTFFVPSTNLTQNSTHLSCYLNTNNVGGVNALTMGALFSGTLDSILLNQESLTLNTRNLNALISSVQSTRLGFAITSKTSATITTLYKNGTSVASGNSGGLLSNVIYKIFLGCLNNTGNANPGSFSNNRIAFNSIGDGLTDAQASAFYTNVQTFQTTIGRQV